MTIFVCLFENCLVIKLVWLIIKFNFSYYKFYVILDKHQDVFQGELYDGQLIIKLA